MSAGIENKVQIGLRQRLVIRNEQRYFLVDGVTKHIGRLLHLLLTKENNITLYADTAQESLHHIMQLLSHEVYRHVLRAFYTIKDVFDSSGQEWQEMEKILEQMFHGKRLERTTHMFALCCISWLVWSNKHNIVEHLVSLADTIMTEQYIQNRYLDSKNGFYTLKDKERLSRLIELRRKVIHTIMLNIPDLSEEEYKRCIHIYHTMNHDMVLRWQVFDKLLLNIEIYLKHKSEIVTLKTLYDDIVREEKELFGLPHEAVEEIVKYLMNSLGENRQMCELMEKGYIYTLRYEFISAQFYKWLVELVYVFCPQTYGKDILKQFYTFYGRIAQRTWDMSDNILDFNFSGKAKIEIDRWADLRNGMLPETLYLMERIGIAYDGDKVVEAYINELEHIVPWWKQIYMEWWARKEYAKIIENAYFFGSLYQKSLEREAEVDDTSREMFEQHFNRLSDAFIKSWAYMLTQRENTKDFFAGKEILEKHFSCDIRQLRVQLGKIKEWKEKIPKQCIEQIWIFLLSSLCTLMKSPHVGGRKQTNTFLGELKLPKLSSPYIWSKKLSQEYAPVLEIIEKHKPKEDLWYCDDMKKRSEEGREELMSRWDGYRKNADMITKKVLTKLECHVNRVKENKQLMQGTNAKAFNEYARNVSITIQDDVMLNKYKDALSKNTHLFGCLFKEVLCLIQKNVLRYWFYPQDETSKKTVHRNPEISILEDLFIECGCGNEKRYNTENKNHPLYIILEIAAMHNTDISQLMWQSDVKSIERTYKHLQKCRIEWNVFLQKEKDICEAWFTSFFTEKWMLKVNNIQIYEHLLEIIERGE